MTGIKITLSMKYNLFLIILRWVVKHILGISGCNPERDKRLAVLQWHLEAAARIFFALFCDPFATTHFSSFTYTNNTLLHTHSVYTCRMHGHSVLCIMSSPCVLYGCHSDCCVSVFPQGEQCNIVPDNVDDIVADIAQEEKEEGLDLAPISLFFLSYTGLKAQWGG